MRERYAVLAIAALSFIMGCSTCSTRPFLACTKPYTLPPPPPAVFWYVMSCIPFPSILVHMWRMVTSAVDETPEPSAKRSVKFIRIFSIVSAATLLLPVVPPLSLPPSSCSTRSPLSLP